VKGAPLLLVLPAPASGLNLDDYGSGNSSSEIPADPDAIATICAARVEEVLSMPRQRGVAGAARKSAAPGEARIRSTNAWIWKSSDFTDLRRFAVRPAAAGRSEVSKKIHTDRAM